MNRYVQTLLIAAAFVTGLSSKAQPAGSHALKMNGSSQYVNCGTINLSNNAVTIQGWITVQNFKPNSPYITSFAGSEQPGSHCAVRIGDGAIPNNRVQFILLMGGTHYKLHSQQALSTNQWYHLAATFDGSVMKIYINGILDTTRVQSGTIASNAIFELGRNYADSRILLGQLDDVSVFSSALSETTIREWMCRRITPNHPNYATLVGYWPLDEGSGSTTADASGNGYNGTLQNSPVWRNSGAPIGDKSKYVYGSAFDLGLSHPDGDSIHFTSTSGTFGGVHIYRVDSVPLVTDAPAPLQYLDTTRYWGIFPILNAAYDVEYHYTGNPTANGLDCSLSFAQRDDGEENAWTVWNPTASNFTSEVLEFSGSGQSEFILAVSNNGPHNFSYDIDQPLCNGDANGTITASITGGTAPYAFDWSTGSTSSSSGNVAAGSYALTVTDDDGCESTDSVTIGEPTALGFASNQTSSICRDTNTGSAVAIPTGGVGGYTFLWSNGATTQTALNLYPGTYSVTVLDTNDCEIVGSVTVNSGGPDPMPNLGGDTNICQGITFGLTAGGSGGPFTSYAWSTGGTGAITIVNGPGIYSVTVMNAVGCSGSDTVEVSYVEPVEVQLGPPNQSGVGSLTLDAGSGFLTYQWSNGNTGQSIVVNQSAIYWVKVKDQNNCKSADTVNVTILANGLLEDLAQRTKIYPNPSADVLRFETPTPVLSATIVGVDGSVIATQNHPFGSIQTDALPSGLYFVCLSMEGGAEITLPFEKF